MTSHYTNPYGPVYPDAEDLIPRKRAKKWLCSYVLNGPEPFCVSVVSEYGFGGCSAVRQFLAAYKDQLRGRVQVIECDVEGDLKKGETVADFYRALVRLVSSRLGDLPEAARRASDSLVAAPSNTLEELQADTVEFFRAIRSSGLPLLLVFYAFDRLPYFFPSERLDWSLLRNLYNDPSGRLYYIVVSRKPLLDIERPRLTDPSPFSNIFALRIRSGLLTEEEARDMMIEPGWSVVQHAPWDNWLAECILDWSGRQSYCLRYLCFHLFERIYGQGEPITNSDVARLREEFGWGLREYFDRLCYNLTEDGLLDSLVEAVNTEDRRHQKAQIDELEDLGYLRRRSDNELKYDLFSSLFKDHLIRRGLLSLPGPSPTLGPGATSSLSPRVQALLDLKSPATDVQAWLDEHYRNNKKAKPDPVVDWYVLMYLTGVMEELSRDDLGDLRRELYYQYYSSCLHSRLKKTPDQVRAYFYVRCERYEKRFNRGAAP